MTIEGHEEGLRGTVITQQCEVQDSNSGKWTAFSHNILYLKTFPTVPVDPLPTERFPEYVRDMLYGEENRLKPFFSVSVILYINSAETRKTWHSSY